MTCPICGIRPAINPGSTCGNSYCQEAAYYQNQARNARGWRRKAAYELAADRAALATETSKDRS